MPSLDLGVDVSAFRRCRDPPLLFEVEGHEYLRDDAVDLAGVQPICQSRRSRCHPSVPSRCIFRKRSASVLTLSEWKYYIVYLGVQAALIVFAYFFYIETKGVSTASSHPGCGS